MLSLVMSSENNILIVPKMLQTPKQYIFQYTYLNTPMFFNLPYILSFNIILISFLIYLCWLTFTLSNKKCINNDNHII